jgi:hypothetical protein
MDPLCDDRNDQQRQLFFCTDCQICLCDRCWPLQPTHGSSEHEQLKYEEHLRCIRLRRILMTPTTELDLEELLSQDRNTTWFGESQKPLEIVQHSTDMMNLATMNTREDEHADYIS